MQRSNTERNENFFITLIVLLLHTIQGSHAGNVPLLPSRLSAGNFCQHCWQNGIHAGQLKSYIQLCLALSEMAKEVKTASPKPQQTENPKFAMRTWMMRLGFIGEEFATARDFLTRNLTGDAAFRNGRAA